MTIKAPTVHVDPLGEIIAQHLFGIEDVPKEHQRRMVRAAVRAAIAWNKEREQERQAMIEALKQAESVLIYRASSDDPEVYEVKESIKRALERVRRAA